MTRDFGITILGASFHCSGEMRYSYHIIPTLQIRNWGTEVIGFGCPIQAASEFLGV